MKVIFAEDERLLEHSLLANKDETSPDFDVPDNLWVEFREAQEKLFAIEMAVITQATPLTDEARAFQQRTWNGLRALGLESV